MQPPLLRLKVIIAIIIIIITIILLLFLPTPWADAETHTHRTLFVASGRCGSTRWSADDPSGLGDSPICPGQATPKLDGRSRA